MMIAFEFPLVVFANKLISGLNMDAPEVHLASLVIDFGKRVGKINPRDRPRNDTNIIDLKSINRSHQ